MNINRIFVRSPVLQTIAASLLLFFCLGLRDAFGQIPSTEEILERAAKERQAYTREFRNLTATETKYFEIYGKDGEPKKQRVVKAMFIILQPNGSEVGEEFRHVLEVDGKPIPGSDVRARKFFEKTASSEAKERKRIYDESLRFDLGIFINGLTRSTSPVLEKRIWPFFSYVPGEIENLSGRNVYKITFQQTRPCPLIWVNRQPRSKSVAPVLVYDIGLPDYLPMNEKVSGTLFIDADTFQLVREERKLTIFPAGFSAPILVDENVIEFKASPFGIRTPTSILHTNYEIRFKEKRSTKRAVVRLTYSSFSKPQVEVRSGIEP